MLDYTLKRRSVRNNCLWKARRGSEVPAEVIWYFIIVLFPLITSRNNCVRSGDKRAGGARDTSSPADKHCPLTIHIKTDGEREKDSIIILTARIILKAEPFQEQNPLISTAVAKKNQEKPNGSKTQWTYTCCFNWKNLRTLNGGAGHLTVTKDNGERQGRNQAVVFEACRRSMLFCQVTHKHSCWKTNLNPKHL